MKILLTVLILYSALHISTKTNLFTFSTLNIQQADTVITLNGKFIDSFKNECDRYAECICAEHLRFLVLENNSALKLTNDTISLFLFCIDDRIKIVKDSIYTITATTKIKPGVLLSYDTTLRIKRFWVDKISLSKTQYGG